MAAAVGPVREDQLPVWVRYYGEWHPMVLTGWVQLERGGWVARLQHSLDSTPVWVRYRGTSLQPITPRTDIQPGAFPPRAGN